MGVDGASGNKTDDRAQLAARFPRLEQTFPALTPQEIARMRRFGELRSYKDGERLFETGKPGPGMFVILSGHVAISQRDGLGHVTPVIDEGPGQFLAEIGQLSGRAALVDGHAEGDVETLLIPPERLRALLVAEADLGERIMRALILRRVSLIQAGVGGPVLIGPSDSAGVIRLQGFLTRNGLPHHLLDPERDHDAAELIARYSPSPSDWPLVIAVDGTVLRNPDETELARALGMIGPAGNKIYDVAIVGCGPAGLATAVYAASEGLSAVILDARSFGGQAGASARKGCMVIRGGGLGASMSRSLIERIEATPNIELVFNTEVVALEGSEDGSLERVRWRSRLSGEESSVSIRNLFLFAGADPATGWRDGCGVTLDPGGFVLTGARSEHNQGGP